MKARSLKSYLSQVHLEIDLSDHKMNWTGTIGQTLMLMPVKVLKYLEDPELNGL